jgi:hypothetical protein
MYLIFAQILKLYLKLEFKYNISVFITYLKYFYNIVKI